MSWDLFVDGDHDYGLESVWLNLFGKERAIDSGDWASIKFLEIGFFLNVIGGACH